MKSNHELPACACSHADRKEIVALNLVAVVLGAMALVALPGCDKEFRAAVKVGQVSKALHDSVAEPVAAEMIRLVEKHKATGSLTEDERARLKLLNDFRPALDGFAAVHESYVAALKVWKATGQKPPDWLEVYSGMAEFVSQAGKLKELLKI